MVRLTLGVQGMTSSSCTHRIERAVAKLPGVVVAKAQLERASLLVRFDEGRTDKGTIIAAVAGAGFEVAEENSNV